jgi:3-hydroxybutyryl-CoA dehydrogenase
MGNGIESIAVIGAGIMGHGIAQEFASVGYRVALVDQENTALDHARSTIARNLETSRADSDTLERIRFTQSLADAVVGTDYVIEAVPERLVLKQRLFADLDRLARPDVILASNTSSFMPSQLASSTSRPDKVVVTHYFNPPHVVPLVEIVRGPETSEDTVKTVYRLYQAIGKSPVVIQKERLGFIGNRLQNALFRVALYLVEEGVCSIEDIDTVMHTSIGRRWSTAGVFEVFDQAGLDTVFAVATQIFPDLSNATAPPDHWLKRVESGDLGIKSGQGFYSWTPQLGEASRRRIRAALRQTGKEIATPEA